LIDEAHALPGRLLEEVRMITNVVRDAQPRVRLVLAGDRLLEERLAQPRLASLNQRVAARCYVQPFSYDETLSFIRQQLTAVGASHEQPFTAEALSAIYQATDGVPRLVNQLCDHALMMACQACCRRIDAGVIERAWADVQRLPVAHAAASIAISAPTVKRSPGRAAASDSVVEFGALSAEPAMMTQSALGANESSVSAESSVKPPPGTAQRCAAEQCAAEQCVTEQCVTEQCVTDQCDPFAEPFADEEIIFDRYATSEMELPLHARVTSAEGGALAAMLAPFLQPARILERLRPPHDAQPRTIPLDDAGRSAGEPHVAINELPPRMPHELGEDENVIVIEEDPQTQIAALGAHGEVRRQEFGQLFAALRRG
jgi:hypothetical protein